MMAANRWVPCLLCIRMPYRQLAAETDPAETAAIRGTILGWEPRTEAIVSDLCISHPS